MVVGNIEKELERCGFITREIKDVGTDYIVYEVVDEKGNKKRLSAFLEGNMIGFYENGVKIHVVDNIDN